MPTVYVVDDDRSVRESLSLLIESAGWRPETYASGVDFLASKRTPAPNCLLLDVVMPDLDGCDVQELVAEHVGTPVIFVTGRGDVPIAVRAMKAGAVDFFLKPPPGAALLDAIRDALDRSSAALRDAEIARRLERRRASLSPREREVMALVVAGRLNKQIAGELRITEFTVKTHRGRVMRKMGAGSLAELVTMSGQTVAATPPAAR
jgi:FixJ family two-component response regulator